MCEKKYSLWQERCPIETIEKYFINGYLIFEVGELCGNALIADKNE